MKIPTDLKHKPVLVSEDYDQVDGRYAHKSDAKGLSLGLAQWNERGKVAISAKVWRHTGEKWSRQSEELPLHRVLDLAILVCRGRKYFKDRYQQQDSELRQNPLIDRVGVQGGALNVALCVENERLPEDIALFDTCLRQDDELLGERLRVLARLLKELEY